MARTTKPNPSILKDLLLNSHSVEARQIERCWRILEPMLVLYYPRYYAETTEELLRQCTIGIESYIHALAGFDPEALWNGWLDVLASHKEQSWPLVSALVDAARDHSKGPRTEFSAGVAERERQKQLVSGLLRDVLFNGDLGRQAAEGGWCYELKLFLMREARVPAPPEIERMKTAWQRVEATMADMERRAAAGEDLLGMDSLRGIYKHMPIREANLAEQILKAEAA